MKFVMINAMKKTSILVSICIFFLTASCKKKIDIAKIESLSIITLLYNKESSNFPIPPPPPPPKNVSIENLKPIQKNRKKEYDSDQIIYKKKFAIIIEGGDKFSTDIIENIPIEYQNIFLKPSNMFSLESLMKINLSDSFGKDISIIQKQGLKIQELTKKYQVLGILFISEIKFNEEFNKAVLVFGSYTHGLAGYTSIYGLKKENGKWTVNYHQLLSES